MCAALLVSLAAADRRLSVVGTVRDDPHPAALTLVLGSTGCGSRAMYADVLQGHQVNGLTVGRHCHCSQRGLLACQVPPRIYDCLALHFSRSHLVSRNASIASQGTGEIVTLIAQRKKKRRQV